MSSNIHIRDFRTGISVDAMTGSESGGLLTTKGCAPCIAAFLTQVCENQLAIEMIRLKRHELCNWAITMLMTALPNDSEDIPRVDAQLAATAATCPQGWDVGQSDQNGSFISNPRLSTIIHLLCKFVNRILGWGNGALLPDGGPIDWLAREHGPVWPRTPGELFGWRPLREVIRTIALWCGTFDESPTPLSLLSVVIWPVHVVAVPQVYQGDITQERIIHILVHALECEPVSASVQEIETSQDSLDGFLVGDTPKPLNWDVLRQHIKTAVFFLHSLGGATREESHLLAFVAHDPVRLLQSMMFGVRSARAMVDSNPADVLFWAIHHTFNYVRRQNIDVDITTDHVYRAIASFSDCSGSGIVLIHLELSLDSTVCAAANCARLVLSHGIPGRKSCAGCGVPAYCHRQCQLADWKSASGVPHKRVCASLRTLMVREAFKERGTGSHFHDECHAILRYDLPRFELDDLMEWAGAAPLQ
ncbi:hypothetical protein BKA62DRAFT_405187 [Auriculariales sp. MPI-PUGE-AT-0066]|nr:hypothetical protein BKA62DRAFT_405187 [Auriculariales sp. MPI-PUGE-AT-0066]